MAPFRVRSPWRSAATTVATFLADVGIFVLVFMLYYVGRMLPSDNVSLANANARAIVDIERTLGVFWEPAWQRAALPHDALIDLANFVYVYCHLYLIPVIGFFVFLKNRALYRRLRNALIISLLIGYPIHVLVPTAPPRLLPELDVADTLGGFVRSNHYAAIPSFHYGWNAFVVFGAWLAWRKWWLLAMGAAFSALMWWSIVVTGNHYFFDMMLGAMIMVPAYTLAVLLDRWLDRNDRARSRLTFTLNGYRLPF